jgi:uncharacterized damage-inducible protein DinB
VTTTSPATEQRVARIQASVQRLVATVERAPAAPLERQPRPEDWSITQVLAHVAEILPYWSSQAREVAARAPGDVRPYGRTHEDPDRIAAVEQHAHDSRENSLARVRASLDEAVGMLRAIPAEGWSRTALHARRGEMSVEQIVDQFLIDHLEEHCAQLEQTLAAVGHS